MKKLLYITIGLFLASFSSYKNYINAIPNPLEQKVKGVIDTLNKEESDIVNALLKLELESERFKNYQNLELVPIEEALDKVTNINAYELAYKNWHSLNKDTPEDIKRLGWILNPLQIKIFQKLCIKDKNYYWKSTDIKTYKVSIMKKETLTKIINSGSYVNGPEKLIIYLSKPLIINKNNAFISFTIGGSSLGFTEISHSTVLMKKINSKWTNTTEYFDWVYY